MAQGFTQSCQSYVDFGRTFVADALEALDRFVLAVVGIQRLIPLLSGLESNQLLFQLLQGLRIVAADSGVLADGICLLRR